MTHLDTLPKLLQYIKLAQQECSIGSGYVRAPRLDLVGQEREEILAIVREGIGDRPQIEEKD